MIGMENRNEFRYNLVNKQTGKRSYSIQYCVGNIHDQIQRYKANMNSMCLVGVSNETHEIESVVWCATGKKVYGI